MYNLAIIEDEELERRAIRTILTRSRQSIHIVGEARNGSEALKLLDATPIDLMLVDINIPKPNGLEIIQLVRERHLATKVVITTAYDYFEIMQSAINLKADNFLLKPIRPEALLEAVDGCLAELGSFRTNSEIAGQVWMLLEQNSYRECLALVRRHVEWIYARKGEPPRKAVLEFAHAMVDLAAERKLSIPAQLQKQIDALPTQRLDDRSRLAVQDVFCQITDVLFDVTEERFGNSPERMQKVLNYIERNLNKGVTLDDVADVANVSACYLSRLFKKSMNITFISYITARRMERAKELLQASDLPVTNISLDLSYNDVNYFCKSFKKEVGVSPTEYRRQCRQLQMS